MSKCQKQDDGVSSHHTLCFSVAHLNTLSIPYTVIDFSISSLNKYLLSFLQAWICLCFGNCIDSLNIFLSLSCIVAESAHTAWAIHEWMNKRRRPSAVSDAPCRRMHAALSQTSGVAPAAWYQVIPQYVAVNSWTQSGEMENWWWKTARFPCGEQSCGG